MQAVLGRGRIGRSLAPNLARDAWGERFHWGSTAGLGSLGLPGPAPPPLVENIISESRTTEVSTLSTVEGGAK